MTDRYKGFVVALESDLRDDDAEGIMTALRHVRGVAGVQPVLAHAVEDQIIAERVNREWRTALVRLLDANR